MSYFLSEFIKNSKKISCSQIDRSYVGQSIALAGWIENQRDHGHFCFFDIKDQTGLAQIFLDVKLFEEHKITLQSIVAVRGILQKRPKGCENPKIKTGNFELKVEEVKVLSLAEVLPIDAEDPKLKGSLKLKYRYLTLRSPRIQKYLILRSRITHIVRNFLIDEGFLEIETPILYKTTPEGARDYLVPSRIHKGQFYSLVQSPQILKQLLMIARVDKYFQLARCFRDEDLRSDRQPEFTQIDLEMSFVSAFDVMKLNERLVQILWEKIKNVQIKEIPSMSYQEALEIYGSDKPDLRNPLQLKSLDSLAQTTNIQIFKKAIQNGGRVKSLALPKNADLSRSAIDRFTQKAKDLGASGLIYLIQEEGGQIKSSLNFDQKVLADIYQQAGNQDTGFVFIVAGDEGIVNTSLSFLIQDLGNRFKLKDLSKDAFLWVTDFPLFKFEDNQLTFSHHPFTAPSTDLSEKELIQKLESCLGDSKKVLDLNLKSKAYDLVCNGQEVAGGSIRNHQAPLQEILFKTLYPHSKEHPFDFFLQALKYGTPPHGGMAWGLDRLVMILSGTDDIRDVLAFPKTLQASCLMSKAPSTIDKSRLREFGIILEEGIE